MRGEDEKRSRNEGEIIPSDLVTEILLKLQAKSIARFRCVSKLWGFTFRSRQFTESFSPVPKLLFTCLLHGKTHFFSSPQPQDLSSPITADYHMSFPITSPLTYPITYPTAEDILIFRPVRGLVCGNTDSMMGNYEQLICNPSTGQFLTLPKLTHERRCVMKIYLGFDPIGKEVKVWCMSHELTYSKYGVTPEHHVLTLKPGENMSWRRVECGFTHYPAPMDYRGPHSVYDGICIDGVLYYLAIVPDCLESMLNVVCFDFRTEKLSYIKRDQGMVKEYVYNQPPSSLVNYKGKLAKLQPICGDVKGLYTGFQLWVLKDAEKHQWSSFTYIFPPPWRSIATRTKLRFVGIINTGEFVFLADSFFLVYYNPERNTITRVGIKGMEAYKTAKVYLFLDHQEDIKLMPSF